MKPAGTFRDGQPVPYPGCTILATPYPIVTISRELDAVQGTLRERVPGFQAIPSRTYHMTVADLVAGAHHVAMSADSKRALIQTARRIIAASEERILLARIAGASTFPGVVIAVVDFVSERDYQWIVDLRDRIYTDPVAQAQGVSRRFPFLGHITLGYIEGDRPHEIESSVIQEIRRKIPADLELQIAGAAVFGFPDMSQYDEIA